MNNNQNMNNGFGELQNNVLNQNINNGFGETQNNVPNQNMNSGFGPNNSFNPNFNNKIPKKKNTKLIIIIAVVVGLLSIIGGRFIIASLAANSYINMIDDGRKEMVFSDARSYISRATYEYKVNRTEGKKCYTLSQLETELEKSPYGTNYTNLSYIIIERDVANQNYNNGICLVDEEGVGISYTSEENISANSVTTGVTCTLPPECN